MKNRLCLLLAAFIWGTTFLFQSLGNADIGPFSFVAVRSLLGSLAVLPILLWYQRSKGRPARAGGRIVPAAGKPWPLWLCSLLIGLCLFAGTALQQVAMLYTTVGKTAFITALYIVAVPILGLVLYRPLRLTHLAGCLLGVLGLYLLTYHGDGAPFNFGDALVLIGVAFWSLHILCVDRFVEWYPGIYLAEGQLVVDALLGFAILPLTGEVLTWEALRAAAVPVLYAGVLSSGGAYALQIIGQQGVPPTEASMLLSLEMVFGALSGALFLHETMTGRELAGAALLLAGILLAQLPGRVLWARRDPRFR